MRALVLSGGGVKGAYQVGALEYLVKEKKRDYDIICGISVGALNAGTLATFPKALEHDAVIALRQLWDTITTPKIHQRWFPFGKIHAAWKNSVYNSAPLQKMVRDNMSLRQIRAGGRQVRVGAVCLETGAYRLFSEKEDCFIEGVLASAAFPAMFCPIKIDGKTWIDGGTKENIPLQAAVDLGATEIDVIVCTPINTTLPFNSKVDALRIAERTVDLMYDEVSTADILKSIKMPEDREIKINIIRPDFDLVDVTLIFEQKEIQRMITIGYADARRMANV